MDQANDIQTEDEGAAKASTIGASTTHSGDAAMANAAAELVAEAEDLAVAEAVAEAELVAEAEDLAVAEAVAEAELVAKAEDLAVAEAVAEAELVAEAEAIAEADLDEEAEADAEAGLVAEAEALEVAEAVAEAELVAEAEDLAVVEVVAEAELVAEAEDLAVAEVVAEAELVAEAEALAEAEIEVIPAAGSAAEMSMMEMLMEEGNYFPGSFQRGDVVDGIVVRIDKQQLILDIGAKQEGIVPASDLMRMPEGAVERIKVGDPIKGIILRPEGEIIVSIHQALTMTDWDNAKLHMESGEILELEIVGYNKGGAIVQYGNLQGFVPRSHLAEGGRPGEDGGEMSGQAEGKMIPVKVIEVSRRKRRLIMSERQALREWRSTRKQRLLETLREGDVRRGRISSVADFGAFVDLGGADGLVHVSEMTHERGKHPRDIVQVGHEVDVQVLSIDREHSRIGLSMKRLQSDPWTRVEQDHYVGELVEATISNLTKFGAFARLDDGLEGLIHVSELSDEHVEHPREAAKPGQRVTVEILSIDPRHKRIGLSIRRVPPQLRHWQEPDEEDAGDEHASLDAAVDAGDTHPDELPDELTMPPAESASPTDEGAESEGEPMTVSADADTEAVEALADAGTSDEPGDGTAEVDDDATAAAAADDTATADADDRAAAEADDSATNEADDSATADADDSAAAEAEGPAADDAGEGEAVDADDGTAAASEE